MKRAILMLLICECLALTVGAQTNHIDTIDLVNWRPANYFLNWCPSDTNLKPEYYSVYGIGAISNNRYDTMDIATFDYHTDDTVLIDGLAIALGFIYGPDYPRPNIVCDTSMDSCYTHAVLYQAHGDSMQFLSRGYVHVANTPVAYYLKVMGGRYGTVPIYEVSIPEVAVFDTFFVGVTSDLTYNFVCLQNCVFQHWPLLYKTICGYDLPRRIMRLHYEMRPAWEEQIIYDFPLMFAIMSEHQPSDSNRTAIETCERLDAVTSVSPSLASDVVTVQCGFNMRNVEVYDIQGRLLSSKRQAGHLTQFNVGAWPEGVYVVRISTVAGITTQRVVVAR